MCTKNRIIFNHCIAEEEGQTGKKKDSEPKKEKINVGIEQIRKVEVYYCDLCRMYLPRVEDSELPRVLSKHCKLRTHMQQYVRYKEDKDLAKHAERLQRKENAEKENKEKKVCVIINTTAHFNFLNNMLQKFEFPTFDSA